jgi:hypothetical protein
MNIRKRMVEICKKHVSTESKAQAITNDIFSEFLTKFKNGTTIVDTIIDKHLPGIDKKTKAAIHNILLDYTFSFEKCMDMIEPEEVTDDDIKKWVENFCFEFNFSHQNAVIAGAKAMRDGDIKHENNQNHNGN